MKSFIISVGIFLVLIAVSHGSMPAFATGRASRYFPTFQASRSGRVHPLVECSMQPVARIFDTFHYPTLLISRDGKIVYMNQETERQLGWRRAELEGQQMELLLSPDLRESHIQCRERFMRYPNSRCMNRGRSFSVKKVDGSIGYFNISLISLRDDPCVLALLVDVSEEVSAYAELRQEMEFAKQTARSLAHDIRTPLQALSGLLEQLRCTSLSEEQAKLVSGLFVVSESVISISRSKIENPDLVKFSIRKMLENQAEIYSLLVGRKNLKISIVNGDMSSITRVIGNLMSNAVKYSESGEIILSATLQESGSSVIRFQVEDPGTGFSEDDLKHVFQEGWRNPLHVAQNIPGTGLGLSGSKKIVEEKLKGKLGISSTLGKGSGVWFDVFLQSLVESQWFPEGAVRFRNSIDKDQSQFRVLVVEDTQFRFLLQKQVQSIGYPCDAVENGSLAVDELIQASKDMKPYDLVLMDNQMPEMDGVESTRRIREQGTLIKQPVILLLSGDDTDQIKQDALRSGANAYYEKPMEFEILTRVLNSYLSSDGREARLPK